MSSMMNYRNPERAEEIRDELLAFSEEERRLHGVETEKHLETLIRQIEDSVRRVRYVSVIEGRPVSERRADPDDSLFNPLKAAVYFKRQGDLDAAFWNAFLSVHFGKPPRGGWDLVRHFCNRLGQPGEWNWNSVSEDPDAVREWLDEYEDELRDRASPARFGNHRKYQSLDAYSNAGTGAAIESYVGWVVSKGSHEELVQAAMEETGGDPELAFDVLYESMDAVASFGRLAKFDYLTLVGSRKLALAPIDPGIPYLGGSTGALRGARLLFGGDTSADMSPDQLDLLTAALGRRLGVGMQMMEDALCNWQKSPRKFKHFGG